MEKGMLVRYAAYSDWVYKKSRIYEKYRFVMSKTVLYHNEIISGGKNIKEKSDFM